MRQFVNGKWIKYEGIDLGNGVAPMFAMERYYPVPSSGLTLQSFDYAQDHWLIGQEVSIDILISYEFGDKLSDGSAYYGWVRNSEISVTLKNIKTGQKNTIFYDMNSFGMSARSGQGIIPLRFFPENMGLAAGRQTFEIEIEGFAQYTDYSGYYRYTTDIPNIYAANNDSKSVEKNSDRPFISPSYPIAPCYLLVKTNGELPAKSQVLIVNITDAKPVAAFSFEPIGGEAPLHVAFTNLSQAPAEFPITNVRWYFGDGAASTSTDPGFNTVVPHIYEKPGTYTVRLVVTNSAGSSEEHWDITIGSKAVSPEFISDGTYLPEAFYPGVEAILKFNIKNNGGAGNIWLKSTCKGVTKTLVASIALDAYTTSKIITMPAHNLEWYAGYKPTLETAVTILFEVGPVGGSVTSNRTWETFETPEGDGHDCATGYHWDEITESCIKDTEPSEGSFWDKHTKKILIGGGIVTLIAGALLLTKKK